MIPVISRNFSRRQAIAAGGGGYSAAVLTDLPLGYWRLGEPSGTTAVDASGNSHNGTYDGTMLLGQPGAIAGDSDTAVRTPGFMTATSSAWNTSLCSFEMWAKFNGSVSDLARIQEGGATDKILTVSYDGNLHVQWTVFDGGSETLTSAPLTFGGGAPWYHIVGVADGTKSRLYINGVQDSEMSASGSYAGYTTPNLKVGGSADYTIDEVAFYSHALSAARVLAHYNAGI